MNDFLFFEITYKLSEILKIVSTKNQGSVIPYLAIFSALSGVAVGFALNLAKEKYTEWSKKEKYLSCIKWEVEYNKLVAEEAFRLALNILDNIALGEPTLKIAITRHYQTICFDKYFHEVLTCVDEKNRNTLCHMQSAIKEIQVINDWLSSTIFHKDRVDVQIKVQSLLKQSGRLLACSEVYLGLKDDYENSNPTDTANELGIHSLYIKLKPQQEQGDAYQQNQS